jgi:hypothetical protein
MTAHRIARLPVFLEGAVERLELGDAGALARGIRRPRLPDQRCDPLGDTGGMGRGQLHDTVGQLYLPDALARRSEKARRRRVRIFLEEMVLDLPGEVAETVRQFELIERVMVER